MTLPVTIGLLSKLPCTVQQPLWVVPNLAQYHRAHWKVVAELWKTLAFLASRGEEFSPGPETRLDRSELLCDKVLLKYKRDRESFWHRHQKRAERVAPLLAFSSMLYTYQQVAKRKEMSQNAEWHQAPHPEQALWDNIGTRWVIPGHKMIDMDLEERQVSKQIHSLINIA